MMGKPAVEERVVAFIDVLGFSALVRGKLDPEDPGWFDRVRDALERSLEAAKIGSPSVEFSRLTDCFVISAPTDRGDAEIAVARTATSVALTMLGVLPELREEECLFCRGGIARGRGVYDGDTVISLGQILAYKLEEKSAVYPRIVVDDDIARKLVQQYGTPNPSLTVTEDFDGSWYLDLFATVSRQTDREQKFKWIGDAVQEELRATQKDDPEKPWKRTERHARSLKWRWCREKLRRYLKRSE